MDPTPLDEGTVWFKTAVAAPETGTLTEDLVCEVAVIGGGYTGLSSALHLALAGINVVVVEAKEIGFGGSGRNAGHCTPTFHILGLDTIRRLYGADKADKVVGLQTAAADLVFDLIERYQINCEATRNGYLRVAHTQARLAELDTKARQYAALGLDSRTVDATETETLSGSKRYFGGWLLKQGGHLNPLGYARGLARAALQEGARIFTQSPAQAVEPKGGQWVVRTPKGSVTADKVIVGSGAYTVGKFWPGLEETYSVIDVAGFATDPLPPDVIAQILPAGTTMVDTHKDPTLYKVDKDGRLVTSTYVAGRLGTDHAATARYLSERTRWIWPMIDKIDWPHHWLGRLDFQPRTFPRFFELAPGVTAAIGFSGRGVPTATAMGRVLAEHARGVPATDLPLLPDRLERTPPFTGLVRRLVMQAYRFQDRYRTWREGITEPRFRG